MDTSNSPMSRHKRMQTRRQAFGDDAAAKELARDIAATYAPWIVRACDRVAAKPDNQVLTNTETDALIRYLHGDEEMEAQQ